MHCIICRLEKADGNEHVIPKALGGSFVTTRVCTGCDNALGNRADQGLIHQYLVEQRRAELSLRGNNRTVPNPMKNSLNRPMVSQQNPNHRLQIVHSVAGEFETKTLPHVDFDVQVISDTECRVELKEFYLDPADWHNAENIVKSALRKKGIRNDDFLQTVWEVFQQNVVGKTETIPFEIPFQIRTGGHHIGLLKIAYEISWHWLGDRWLDDPIANTMRNALRGDDAALAEVQGKVTDAEEVLTLGGCDNRRTHLLFTFPALGKYFVTVRLLDVFNAFFLVTNDAARYSHPKLDAILMDAVARKYRERTFASLLQAPEPETNEPAESDGAQG